MEPRPQSVMGECETRTQEVLVAALRARPRTLYRAVQCVLEAKASIFNSLPAARPRKRCTRRPVPGVDGREDPAWCRPPSGNPTPGPLPRYTCVPPPAGRETVRSGRGSTHTHPQDHARTLAYIAPRL